MTVLHAAHAVQFAFLEHAQQLGLKPHIHFGNLVQEQGAVVGQFELAGLAADGPCKGSLFVAEQLALQQVLRQGRAVDGDEGKKFPVAVGMHEPGEHLLARAGFAGDKNGGLGRGNLFGQGQDPGHGRMAAHDPMGVAGNRNLGLARCNGSLWRPRRRSRGEFGKGGLDLVPDKGPHPVVPGPEFHEPLRLLGRASGGEGDDRREIGIFGGAGQEVIHAVARQAGPGEDQLGPGLVDEPQGALEVFRQTRFQPLFLEAGIEIHDVPGLSQEQNAPLGHELVNSRNSGIFQCLFKRPYPCPKSAYSSPSSPRRCTSSSRVRTPKPVPPRGHRGVFLSAKEGPAISMWAQGISSATNWLRNMAALTAPPSLRPVFLRSAKSLFISSR